MIDTSPPNKQAFYEQVDGARLRAESIRVELIRWIANDHVKLHIASKQLGHPSLDIVGMDQRIGVRFKPLAPVKGGLAGAAIRAPAVVPRVFHPLEPDVAVVAGEGVLQCTRS